MLAVAAGGLGATSGGVLVAVVAVPYVALLAAGPRVARKLPLGLAELRFVRRSFGERHRRERSLDSRREAVGVVVVLLLALCLIVAGSVGAVRAATDLAQAWSVPEALVGVVVLAILTSLPNAWTGVRFGLQRRGSALMSETLNSNSINIVAGLADSRRARHSRRLLGPRDLRHRVADRDDGGRGRPVRETRRRRSRSRSLPDRPLRDLPRRAVREAELVLDDRGLLDEGRGRREDWLAAAIAAELSEKEQRTLLAAIPLLQQVSGH